MCNAIHHYTLSYTYLQYTLFLYTTTVLLHNAIVTRYIVLQHAIVHTTVPHASIVLYSVCDNAVSTVVNEKHNTMCVCEGACVCVCASKVYSLYTAQS